jgi:molybdopterin-guanine dinucleotide biosynthesis protein A
MCSAAILAGGAARRFGGRDKTRLVVDGRTVIDRQLSALAPLTTDILLVGAPPGRQVPPGLRAVADRRDGLGPLGGLHTALLEAAGDPTLILACDMPFVTTALLERLLALMDDADAAVPRTDRGYHPVCAVYARRSLPAIERRLADGRLKMVDLLDDLRVRAIDADDLRGLGDPGRLLANINTPVDHREADALQGHEP